jgi:hypothetical protein
MILAVLGHFVADFVLQPKKMALQKSAPGWRGFVICTLHVLIYTVVICVFLGMWSPLIIILIGVPHWILDRWSLGNVWLKMIRGRTFEGAFHSSDKYREFDIAFTSIVYVAVDATFHILSLFAVIRLVIFSGI